jgi:hypothetical protein
VNWSTIFGFSQNRNRLVTLGPTTLPPVGTYYGTGQNRYVAGYPLNGFWERPILGYSDVNGDGIITREEVRVADSAVYRGQPFPKAKFTLYNSLSFFSGWLTLAGAVDYTYGLTQLNGALDSQCNNSRCPQYHDPNTSLLDQAYAVVSQAAENGGTSWGFMETGSYARLTELSLSLAVPQRLVQRLNAQSASVSIMGRNLGLWSKYKGADPEVNQNLFANQLVDQGGVPQPRDWTIRVNLRY